MGAQAGGPAASKHPAVACPALSCPALQSPAAIPLLILHSPRPTHPLLLCRGLVASFAGASGVALWRCAAQLRFQHEFEEMLRAVALGESDRFAGWCWWARAAVVGACTASRQAACSRNRHTIANQPSPCKPHHCHRQSGVPVSEISLARCGTATDAAVGAVCDTLGHLQRVDLSRCVEVSDAAMVRLAAYTRQPEFDSDADDEDWVDAAGGAAAASEAIGGLQLAPEEAATPPGSNAGTAPGSTPAMESPDSAVRRIAAQHHAAMLVRSAAAGVCRILLAPVSEWSTLVLLRVRAACISTPPSRVHAYLSHPSPSCTLQPAHSMGGRRGVACRS